MAQATIAQVISQFDALKTEELQQLGKAVQERLRPASEEAKQAAFH